MKITDTEINILKNRILENERLESKADASYEFFERIVKIFERIPAADAEGLLRKNFYLVIPFSNTVYKRKINSGDCWLVFFQSDLWDQKRKDEEILYTIAHELAHQLHQILPNGFRNPTILRLYYRAIENGLVLDDYAAANVMEYFAQGVEAFFQLKKMKNLKSRNITVIHAGN